MIKIFSNSVLKNLKIYSKKSLRQFVEKATSGKTEKKKISSSKNFNNQSQSKQKLSELKNITLNNSENNLTSNNHSKGINLNNSSNDQKNNVNTKYMNNMIEPKNCLNFRSHDKFHSSHEKSIDNYTIEDFLKLFLDSIPLQFDKRAIIQPDENLSCFIQYTDIINKPKATSLAKQFLEDVIVYLNTGEEKIFEKRIYEENLIRKLKMNLDKLIVFNKEQSSFIKYQIYFKPQEEKLNGQFKQKSTNRTPKFLSKNLKFNINLFNIRNYICLGVEPDRKFIKNTKLLSHYQNMIMENPLKKNEESENIKTDVITYRESSKFFLREFDSVPLSLLSQFEYSFLPFDDKNKIYLVLEIKDELNEKVKKFEFSLNSVDIVTECVFFNMTYGDIIKMEKEVRKENVTDNSLDLDENGLGNDGNRFRLEDEYGTDMNMNKDIYNMWKYMKREQLGISNSKFKIIDVNNFMNGNNLI